ncbi:hypothetical protein EVAR_40505_1 [Eumeta japonica]|uniref:Uncharacterized protein n=1 Tax=Eumeta variegata TaxID=151549 RepID=A0A4C1XYG4_EUMVA|nr:hypothetical protein EVAR_40505_1 [Eumeta japonica]
MPPARAEPALRLPGGYRTTAVSGACDRLGARRRSAVACFVSALAVEGGLDSDFNFGADSNNSRFRCRSSHLESPDADN